MVPGPFRRTHPIANLIGWWARTGKKIAKKLAVGPPKADPRERPEAARRAAVSRSPNQQQQSQPWPSARLGCAINLTWAVKRPGYSLQEMLRVVP